MNWVFRAISYVGAGLIVGLALLTGADIVGRYLFSAPIIGATEITSIVLVVIGSLGIAVSTATDEHIHVDVVYVRLRPAGQRVLRLVAALTGVIVFGVLTWQSTIAFSDSISTFYETTDRLSLPHYPIRLVLALAFLICLAISVGQLFDRPPWKPEADDKYKTVV
jgi:TRAP-type transport system small permease protein